MIIRPMTADGGSPPSRKIHLIVAQALSTTLQHWFSEGNLISQIFAILFTVCICVSTTVGWTYRLVDVDDKIPSLTVAWVAQLLFTPAVSTVKLSILVFYLRLSTSKCFRYCVFGGIIFVTLWFISFETVIAMTCDTPEDPVGFTSSRLDHCVTNLPTTKYHGITNIITDFFVYFLPIPLLWGLNMPPRRRLGFYLWLFAALELDLGIICASAPALKMFVVRSIHNCSSENENVPNLAQPTPPRISQFIGNNVRNQGLNSLCSVEVSVGAPEEMTMSRNSMYGMRRGSLVPRRNSDIIEDAIDEEQGGEGSGGITKTVEFSFHEESTSDGRGSVASRQGSTSQAGSAAHSG
ncbi:hypothetical protein DL98DRAFT_533111 [Cadophora sp. DSE1049]|nr:hypothetical protein DL98DRAFT_533111 [Cadophora sp. DSE1049]